MSNKTYDKVKWAVLIFLPALTTLVGVIGQTLGWANTDTIITIMTAVTAFLGTITGASNIKYNKQ